MVDNRKELMNENITEFNSISRVDDLVHVPIVILVNAHNSPDARDMGYFVQKLDLYSQFGRLWHIQNCSATTGDGLKDGFTALSQMMMYCRKTRNS